MQKLHILKVFDSIPDQIFQKYTLNIIIVTNFEKHIKWECYLKFFSNLFTINLILF